MVMLLMLMTDGDADGKDGNITEVMMMMGIIMIMDDYLVFL